MSPNPSNGQVDRIINDLQERAKELDCLYRVHGLLHRPDASPDDLCRGLVEALPSGWQYPAVCWARVILEGAAYQPPRVEETPWVLRAPVVVQGEQVGSIEVFYSEELPLCDEGPFLVEERRLLDTIAERVGHWVMQRRLHSTLRAWRARMEDLSAQERPSWWVIVEFLRNTDRQLLMRISRRMVNYLCWNGIDEAQQLLQRFALSVRGEGTAADENRPLQKSSLESVLSVMDDAFRIAATHLSDEEILECIERWIKDDKSGFLIEAVENLGTSLTEISAALERYEQLHLGEHALSRARQQALRAALVRRFLTEDLDFINTAKQYLEVDDFHDLVRRIISPTGSHGKLGGKSAGLFLAAQILRRSSEYASIAGEIRTPRTWYLTSDALLNFIEFNHLEDVYDRKYLDIDQVRREYPHIVQVFKHSDFPPEITKGLSLVLDDFEEHPIVVRSSSLLEDRVGAAFSGKYKSLFLANQGTKRERLLALMDAIAEVWASIFGPDPIEYRAERGLLDVHEEMGIMVQEVVGSRVGPYFLPSYAGVAFTFNEFRWSARIQREDGLVRLVPGLGTRAVDRVNDDYPTLISPGQAGLRANVTADEAARYSPRNVDLINLDTRQFETVAVTEFFERVGVSFPGLADIVSIWEDDQLHAPMGLLSRLDPRRMVVTFDGLIERTSFVTRIRAVLRILREKLGYPVDIEFACDGKDFYLLQCRAQSSSGDTSPAVIPTDVAPESLLFVATRYVANGRIPDLTHVVYVDPDRYSELADLESLKDVGRAVGRLNKILPKRQFALLGPGRWGSRGDIRLGVSVTYSDINNTALLVEIAQRRGNYVPEVSFGTHFFQDLVEAGIRYLPLFPGDRGGQFNRPLIDALSNSLGQLLPEFAHLEQVLRVIDVTKCANGQVLRVLMNGDKDRAIGFLVTPGAASVAASRSAAHPGGVREPVDWAAKVDAATDAARRQR